jgi:hypothetical protein
MEQPTPRLTGRSILWITVSDRVFFPGTVAAVNSIRYYHPNSQIAVVSSDVYNTGLSEVQMDLLKNAGVAVYASCDFEKDGRILGAWQLKAYAAADLSVDHDMVIGIDSDAVLCSNVQDVIDACFEDGKMRGGKDGDGVFYDASYAQYGFRVPAQSQKYMSTSMYFVPLTGINRTILMEWAMCCNTAVFGPQTTKVYPGHGDQGVLNSVIYKHCKNKNVELLENSLFSQHWVYLNDIIIYENHTLINRSVNKPQRAFHCGGTMKFWSAEHSQWLSTEGQNQTWSYAHWLRMLWFGEIIDWRVDPAAWIDPVSHHLWNDLVYYYLHIEALATCRVRAKWDEMTDIMLTRFAERIPRAMTIGGSMSQYIQLAKTVREGGIIVEVGSFHGGSIVTLAIALLHRNIHIVSVESFMGNYDGTVDGYALSDPKSFIYNVKCIYPYLNVSTYPLDSENAARRFAVESVDMIFIDGNHSTASVLKDIDTWRPKVKRGGILAGDDIGWESVRIAIEQKFGRDYQQGNDLWWITHQ